MTIHCLPFGFLLAVVLLADYALAQIGDACTMDNTGRSGICQSIGNCPITKEQAREGIRPTICGSDRNSLPIVCCEGRSNTPNFGDINSNLPISEQKCKEYNKPIGPELSILSLIADSKPMKSDVPKCNDDGIPLIVGGTPAMPGEFPFMAVLGYNGSNGEVVWDCGATLISERFVLTAAHCLSSRNWGVPILVRLGAHDLTKSNDKAMDFGIARVIKHPDHRFKYSYNDIALLELNGTVKFVKTIRPACLWNKNEIDHTSAIATGWGFIDANQEKRSDELLKVRLYLISNAECSESYETSRRLQNGIVDTMLCAGDLQKRRDTCQGDSGGPLFVMEEGGQCTFYIIGITSFGQRCAIQKPAVYTRVSSFVDWIEKNVW